MWRRQRTKPKRTAWIVRLVWRLGWKPGRVMREVLEWVEVLAVAGALAALIISFVTVRMHVPTDSMWPTINGDPSLLRADSFFVDRLTYHFRRPSPGSIVVFRHTDKVLVGAVSSGSAADHSGLARGDQITHLNEQGAYTGDVVAEYVASLTAGTPLTIRTADGRLHSLGAVPRLGTTLEDLGIEIREVRTRYVKRLIAVGGQTVQIRGGDVYIDGERLEGPQYDHYYVSNRPEFRFGVEPTLVPEGNYFVLGDNSDDSLDSRYWGFVDESDMIGVPYLRVWPLSRFGLIR